MGRQYSRLMFLPDSVLHPKGHICVFEDQKIYVCVCVCVCVYVCMYVYTHIYILHRGIYIYVPFWGGVGGLLHPGHMEVPRLGVESELQLPAYTTTIVTPAPNHVCKLYHSLWHHQILNPLRKDRTRILMDISQVCYH